ncbi:hypothetical protein GGR40_004274 [Novosphingobium gossypii]
MISKPMCLRLSTSDFFTRLSSVPMGTAEKFEAL